MGVPTPWAHRAAWLRPTRPVGRAGLALVALTGLTLAGPAAAATSHGHRGGAPGRHPAAGPPAVESGLLPWALAAPISRVVVLPAAGGQLVLLGGLTAAGTSANGVFTLNPASGALASVGTLPAAVHDGAGAVVAGSDVIFGGGSPTTVATVQAFAPVPPGAAGASTAGTVIGALPAPRSDDATVSIGRTTYVVGGYDGTNADVAVLATTDGRHFRTVARLRVPVRYPAVAATGGKIYVFGGQAVGGTGQAVDAIQVVDPSTHRVVVGGHLPEASNFAQPSQPGRGIDMGSVAGARQALHVGPDQAVALRRRRLRHPVAALGDSVQHPRRPERPGARLQPTSRVGRGRRHRHLRYRRNQYPHPAGAHRAATARQAGPGRAWWACSRTSSRAPWTSRGRCAPPASRFASADSTSPAACRCCRKVTPEIKEAMDLGISLFAGEAEGRFDKVLRDAWNGTLKPLYNYMDDLPSLDGAPLPMLPASRIKRTAGKHDQLRCRPRLPIPVLVLHHHQCAGAEIAAPLGRRHRADRAAQSGAGHQPLLHHRRQLRAQ